MKDRFKFRAKDLKTNEWVYGGYDRCENDYYIFKAEAICIEPDVNYSENVIVNIPVDPKTVGQSTGLKDKNGKLIFEGNVVRYRKHIGTIEWRDGGFLIRFGDMIATAYITDCDLKNHCEIIGNIHENPELLNAREMSEDE